MGRRVLTAIKNRQSLCQPFYINKVEENTTICNRQNIQLYSDSFRVFSIISNMLGNTTKNLINFEVLKSIFTLELFLQFGQVEKIV